MTQPLWSMHHPLCNALTRCNSLYPGWWRFLGEFNSRATEAARTDWFDAPYSGALLTPGKAHTICPLFGVNKCYIIWTVTHCFMASSSHLRRPEAQTRLITGRHSYLRVAGVLKHSMRKTLFLVSVRCSRDARLRFGSKINQSIN